MSTRAAADAAAAGRHARARRGDEDEGGEASLAQVDPDVIAAAAALLLDEARAPIRMPADADNPFLLPFLLGAERSVAARRFTTLLERVSDEGPVAPFVAMSEQAPPGAPIAIVDALASAQAGRLELPVATSEMAEMLRRPIRAWLTGTPGATALIESELGSGGLELVTDATLEEWLSVFRSRLLAAAGRADIEDGGLDGLDGRLLADVALLDAAQRLQVGLDAADPELGISAVIDPFQAVAFAADREFASTLGDALASEDPAMTLRRGAPTEIPGVAGELEVVNAAFDRIANPQDGASVETAHAGDLLRADLEALVTDALRRARTLADGGLPASEEVLAKPIAASLHTPLANSLQEFDSNGPQRGTTDP